MITLLCIGKMKDRALQSLVDEYTRRLSAFTKFSVEEVKDEPNPHEGREREEELCKEREGARALSRIRPDDFVILLDLHGRMLDSETFAEKLSAWQQSHPRITLVIAGSLGPSPDLVRRADFRWKLSDLTFTHLMTRVLVAEQLYRAFMISSGRTYHK